MKIIKEINDTEFVVKLEPQDYEKSRELNVVIAHDYVQFGRKMELFTEHCDELKSVHKVCANVMPEYQTVQIPIRALIEVILPLLNNHEYCQKEHLTFEGKPQYTCSETSITYHKDKKFMIAVPVDGEYHHIPYSLYYKIKEQ